MFHLMAVHGAKAGGVSMKEPTRMRFVGRGNTPAAPRAMIDPAPLSGSEGSVLDPIAAIRVRVTLEPEQAATIDMVYGVAATRVTATQLIRKYQDPRLADRVVELAWTHAQVVLRQINATEADARLYARLANSIVFANASLERSPQSSAAIAADNPDCGATRSPATCRSCCCASRIRPTSISCASSCRRTLTGLRGLAVDLVIWNEDRGGYRQLLQDQIIGLVAARVEAQLMKIAGTASSSGRATRSRTRTACCSSRLRA
jgi:cellobiose phosphorylase